MKIKLFYYTNVLNFGDILNELICEKIFNIKYVQADIYNCDAVFIGSLLNCFLNKHFKFVSDKKIINRKPVNVWGTGFISDRNKRMFNLPDIFKRDMNINACRGLITKKRLGKILHKDLSDLIVGDPGLLASLLLDKIPSKKYKLGIISHYIEENNPIWQSINNNIKHSTIIDIREKPMQILNKIAECEIIISSAMHGLIAADSLHIPNIRVVISNNIIGGDYKFNDYYSALGVENHKKLFLRDTKISDLLLDTIYNDYFISQNTIENIQQNLIKVFPYKESD